MLEGKNSQVAFDIKPRPWANSVPKLITLNVYTALKRLFDIILAVVFLIISLPLMVVIAILIKLDSPGPILFRQMRIGQNRRNGFSEHNYNPERRGKNLKGRPFNIYKFRTMRIDASQYDVSPKENKDPRLTKSGKFLRATSLDELPQLLNVLKGDMSLVGPRPEMSFIVENYTHLDALRLNVKPGITGLWQIKGARAQKIHENLEYDLEYIKNRSLWYDFKIMIRTIVYMMLLRNI